CAVAALAAGAVGPSVAGAAAEPLAAVTVSDDVATKPTVTFDKPFAVKRTTDKVVPAGTGAALAKGQTITFDYVLLDGRTGKELEASYGKTPSSLTLDKSKTLTQLVSGLSGQTVGSRMLVAIAPKDGVAKRLTSSGTKSGVKKSDTLLFVIDVRSVRAPLARASGEPVPPVGGLPTVALAGD